MSRYQMAKLEGRPKLTLLFGNLGLAINGDYIYWFREDNGADQCMFDQIVGVCMGYQVGF